MSRFNKYLNHGYRTCSPTCACDEDPTREGLAYTPSDMMRLAERGMPVNNLNNQKVYFDGSPDATFHVGDERLRGVDVADLWERQQVLREKARKAAYSAKRNKVE